MARLAAENAKLKRMVEERDEKLSSSATELANLKAAKDGVEEELDRNFEQLQGRPLSARPTCSMGGYRPLVLLTSTTRYTKVI